MSDDYLCTCLTLQGQDDLPASHLIPNLGGCWFCHTDVDAMLFSKEWDAYLHEQCLKQALADGVLEAEIMAEGFNIAH